MYNTIPIFKRECKIYLHNNEKNYSRVFNSIDHFFEEISFNFITSNVGEHYGDLIKIVDCQRSGISWNKETGKIEWRFPEQSHTEIAEYIVRTELGERLTVKKLDFLYCIYRAERYRTRPRPQGLKSGNCYPTYRNPKTRNEIRQAFQLKEEGEPPIRAKRNIHHIVTSWDDRMSSASKSWKSQSKRKTQYYK